MKRTQKVFALAVIVCAALIGGCRSSKPKPYGEESGHLFLPGSQGQIWAIAPATNLSGIKQVDPLLQSDLVYQQLQKVSGLTVIPVNRVAEVYASLKIDKVQTEQQAQEVCSLLGCDALLVPTVTAYDPYDPPKMGASLQLLFKPGVYQQPPPIDVRELDRSPSPDNIQPIAQPQRLVQSVGVFDASQGSIRKQALEYSRGRIDPNGPMGDRLIFQSMDDYGGFVYHQLIADLLGQLIPESR